MTILDCVAMCVPTPTDHDDFSYVKLYTTVCRITVSIMVGVSSIKSIELVDF